jgi:hypothetical protein
MHTQYLWRNLLENTHLEDKEEDRRITLKWILGRQTKRMGGGWNWLRIISNGRICYWQC